MKTIEDHNTGNSGKRWSAQWHNGEPVKTRRNTDTLFYCGTHEAERFEHTYRVYLTEVT